LGIHKVVSRHDGDDAANSLVLGNDNVNEYDEKRNCRRDGWWSVALKYYLTLISLPTPDEMMTCMRRDPLLWIVLASIAMAVGTTAILMTILEYNSVRGISNTNTILGIGGVAIGLIGPVIGYYSQNKPNTRMERLFTELKIRKRRKKSHYLNRIRSNTLLITKSLVRLESLIDNYSDDPPPKDWQVVRYSADRSRKKIEDLGKKIILDFTQIIDLVENSRLTDKFAVNSLYYSWYLFDETLRINPEYDKEPLTELRKGIREQITQLDDALSLLKEEEKRI
jgi:hypothetical protein